MASKTKSGKYKRKLSLNQLNKQLKIWAKNYTSKYNEIIMQAEQRGILNEDNTINDSNKSMFVEFMNYYTKYYGSYSNFLQHEKEKYATGKAEGIIDASSFKEWFSERKDYADLVEQLFNTFTSTIAYEEWLYLNTLSREEAKQRLKEELANGNISPISNYESEYGNLKPNWERK